MISRRIKEQVATSILRNPVVVLAGTRKTGKTTLALELSEIFESEYLDLANRQDAEKAKNLASFHRANRDKLIIIDEAQRSGRVLAQIKSIIEDEGSEGGRVGQFLLLGVGSNEFKKSLGENIGREVPLIELGTIDVLEYAQNEEMLWEKGGYPESLFASSNRYGLSWRNEFIRNYLERDVSQLAGKVSSDVLERLLIMLAHQQGEVLNAASLARSLGVSGVSVGRYLDLMESLLLIKRLKAWTAPSQKRLVKTPKVFIHDSGIAHALLNIHDYNDLLGHPGAGGSWEGFVIQNILRAVGEKVNAYFYKTSGGAEIDLLLEFSEQERWAIEISRSLKPNVSKGFQIASEDVGASRRFLVYAGGEDEMLEGGITAGSLKSFSESVVSRVLTLD